MDVCSAFFFFFLRGFWVSVDTPQVFVELLLGGLRFVSQSSW